VLYDLALKLLTLSLRDLMMFLIARKRKEEAAGNSNSFLRVIKPEIDLPDSTDLYSDEVYQKGRETF
jgi:uncharacterized protein (DUF1015 family)